jgi:hypothetical protein
MMPTLRCVQPVGNSPLARALGQVRTSGLGVEGAVLDRQRFMFPWDQPHSIAHGILDDETYDWVRPQARLPACLPARAPWEPQLSCSAAQLLSCSAQRMRG